MGFVRFADHGDGQALRSTQRDYGFPTAEHFPGGAGRHALPGTVGLHGERGRTQGRTRGVPARARWIWRARTWSCGSAWQPTRIIDAALILPPGAPTRGPGILGGGPPPPPYFFLPPVPLFQNRNAFHLGAFETAPAGSVVLCY